MNLFIIGNSFSQNASRYLPELAAESGHELNLGRAESGGCSLQRHWEHVEAEERGEPEGKFYRPGTPNPAADPDLPRHSLRDLLTASQWDVAIFHQGSLPSPDVASYRPYARLLVDYIRDLAHEAQVILHQTWAYRCDASQFGEIGPGREASGPREMWEYSRAAYHTIAHELDLPLIPTGDAFWKVESEPQWCYRKDPNFNFESPLPPGLPDQTHSLHAGYYWSQEGQFLLDFKHTSNAGSYLGSLMWAGFLFDLSPEEVTFVPPNVPADFAAHLRFIAAETLRAQRPPSCPV